MANMTLINIVANAAGELGLSVPTTVIGNAVQETSQMLYLTNSLLRDLVREYDWQTCKIEYRFNAVTYTYTGTTTNTSISVTAMSSTTGLTSTPTYFMVTGTGIPQDTYLTAAGGGTVTLSQPATASGTGVQLTFSQTKYAFPSDYDRLVDKTDWDKSKHWEMLGPETSQQWQWLKSGFISTGPRIRFRPLGGFFQIWPPMGTNDLLGLEYVSKNCVLTTTDVVTPSKSSFTVDTDTCCFPDQLMVNGLKHKYFMARGWGDQFQAEYLRELTIAKSNDAGSLTLQMAPRISELLIGWQQIPDSGYGT